MILCKRTKGTLIQLIGSYLPIQLYFKIFKRSKSYQSLLEININDYIAYYIKNNFKSFIQINKYLLKSSFTKKRQKIIYYKVLSYYNYTLDLSLNLFIEDFVEKNIINEYKLIDDGKITDTKIYDLFNDKIIISLKLFYEYENEIIAYKNNTNNFKELNLFDLSFLKKCLDKHLTFQKLICLTINISSNEEIETITKIQSIEKLTLHIKSNEELNLQLNFEKLIQFKNLKSLKIKVHNYYNEFILTKELLSKIETLKIINELEEYIFFKVKNFSKNDTLTLENIKEFKLKQIVILADLDLPNLEKLKFENGLMDFNNVLLKFFPYFDKFVKDIQKIQNKHNNKIFYENLKHFFFKNTIMANENKLKSIDVNFDNINLIYNKEEKELKIKIKDQTFVRSFNLKNTKIIHDEKRKINVRKDKKCGSFKLNINEKKILKSYPIHSFEKLEEVNLEIYDFNQISSFQSVKKCKELKSCKITLTSDKKEVLSSKELLNFFKSISYSPLIKNIIFKTKNINDL